MKRTGILALTLLMLTACAPEESVETPQTPIGSRGKAIVFRSNVDPGVVALYLEEGSYRNHGDVAEVGGPSDIGGSVAPCGEGISKCVEVAGLYLMVPPPGEARWNFGGYDFRAVAASSDREGDVVTVSRDGDESYSYGFSPQCGVRWLNVSVGGEGGKEVFYPVGRSLFSETVCTSGPTG
jgi:hypothetical protein